MGWLPTSILPSEACFAYVVAILRLTDIYVPFVEKTEALLKPWRSMATATGSDRRQRVTLARSESAVDMSGL